MNYSKIIKKLREKLILSQTEFAAMLGISFITVSRWEQGKNIPTIKMKRKIAELCKLNNINMGE
ncbi:MAG: helix-turn-helix transcriptional regulator [Candidatus Delongbacteria bacterium]|nr:helix-turn-helix transcriptional regulator [Candidatus Delongbacteria bacterium]